MNKSKQPSLNLDIARNLGALLRSGRESENLTPQEVADKLLFSKAQVLGLEAGETHFFYGNRLFAQCADKYATFLGLTELPSKTLLAIDNAPVVCEPNTTAEATSIEAGVTAPVVQDVALAVQADTDETIIAMPSKRRSIRPFIIIAVSVVGLFVIATILWQTEPKITESVVAAQPVVTAPPVATTPSPEPHLSQSQPTTEKKEQIPSGSIKLSFSGSSWVQVVETNGTRKDKTHKAGDTLILEPKKLQALVIGNAKVVKVTSEQGEIRVNGYMAPGSQVARIIGDNVRQLGR